MTLPPLSADQVLRAWEQSRDIPPPQQALHILSCAGVAEPGALTIGQRDAALLRLRADSFGPTLWMRIPCPHCGTLVRAAVEVADIEASGREAIAPPGGTRHIDQDGWHLTYRLPTASDMAAISHCADAPAAQALLLRNCVLRAHHDDADTDPATMPPALRDALSTAIEAWEPLAETALAIQCGACSHAWHAVLEIAAFLHEELADTALRLVREVDELARRYGWSETEILAMSSARRRAYLDLPG